MSTFRTQSCCFQIVELEINLNPDEVEEKKSKVASAPELPVALGCIVVSLRCAVGSSAWLVCCGFLSTGPSFLFSGIYFTYLYSKYVFDIILLNSVRISYLIQGLIHEAQGNPGSGS